MHSFVIFVLVRSKDRHPLLRRAMYHDNLNLKLNRNRYTYIFRDAT